MVGIPHSAKIGRKGEPKQVFCRRAARQAAVIRLIKNVFKEPDNATPRHQNTIKAS
jgi:hypothetical protein